MNTVPGMTPGANGAARDLDPTINSELIHHPGETDPPGIVANQPDSSENPV